MNIPNRKFTSKQEKFALAIVDGMNQSDAYKSVYEPKNTLPVSRALAKCRIRPERMCTTSENLRVGSCL